VDQRKAEIEKAISIKYGETDRAADYGAQAGEAGMKVKDIQAQIAANAKEAAALDASRNKLTGHTDAAIDNRQALVELQSVMLEQIKAYAATGATTEQVTALTLQLQQQFIRAATSAGYTAQQVSGYTTVFNQYINVIKSVPKTVTTTAVANTKGAVSALNAIPKSGKHTTSAVMDNANYNYVIWKIAQIPKRGDYVITPSIDGGGAAGAAGGIGAGIGAQIGHALSGSLNNSLRNSFNGIIDSFNRVFGRFGTTIPHIFSGGLVSQAMRGYAAGGLIAGTPPRNPNVDNVVARGPGGVPVGLRSGEFVVKQQIVDKPGMLDRLEKLNRGDFKGFYGGGSVGGSGSSVPYTELSPRDRQLLAAIAAKMNVALYVDSTRLASAVDRGNERLAKQGAG
jgi:hypothetical protein